MKNYCGLMRIALMLTLILSTHAFSKENYESHTAYVNGVKLHYLKAGPAECRLS